MIESWYRRARVFLLKQRQIDLKKAIERHPNSDRLQLRTDELRDIEKELQELKE